MGVIRKKPYEISIWEDRLVTENDISYYKEIKLAVIGSDKMESPNRVFDPILTENVNGEKTLTFSLAYHYYDEYTGETITNPFYEYLINERKVKLFYNDEWFEFVIKECEETSTENIFEYTAKELFSLELSKLGYNVTLDQSLSNNQGTVVELAKQVLEETDWQVDETNSDILIQYVQEPLYKATTLAEINVLDLDTNETVPIEQGEVIYIFYSFVNNQIVDNVQFIREKDRNNFFIDDDNVIKSTNYRILSTVKYIINSETQQTELEGIATIIDTYFTNQGYRQVYKNKTTYDPIMERTVDVYQASYGDGNQTIYHFLDYNYTSSDVVLSYITNGSDFKVFEDGKLQGWYNTTTVSSEEEEKPTLQPIQIVTDPPLEAKSPLLLIDDLSALNGYLELKFHDTLTNKYENTYFNQGFEHNRESIDHISQGDEFVLRTRYYTSSTRLENLTAGIPTNTDGGIRVIVAKYEQVEQECYVKDAAEGETLTPSIIKAYKIIPDDIILDFNGNFVLSPNIIDNGIFDSVNNPTQYLVDNVVQTPSTAYIYKTKDNNTEYIWDAKKHRFVVKGKNDFPFADYYATTAQARYSFTNEQMNSPEFKMGIFVYIKDESLVDNYIYLQDIQLTRCVRDGNKQIVTLGNVPTAIVQDEHNYYLKPEQGKTAKEVTTYGDLQFLANELGINRSDITPVFNEECQKVLSIQAKNSNYFNILQELCETFECWLDIEVEHEKDGSIKLDEYNNPIKKVAFKEYAGKDNFAGFKNGINLKGITRTIDSNEIVTKLIVDPVQSEYSDTGSIDIQQAKSNSSGQSYILNLSYYLNRGLITNIDSCNEDIITHNDTTKTLNDKIIKKQTEYVEALKALDRIAAQRSDYTALIDEATQTYNESLIKFQEMTNWDYNAFVTEYQNVEAGAIADENKDKNLLEDDTIMDVIGEIYVASITLSNYTGILTNLNAMYEQLFLQCYGAKEYGISVVSIPGDIDSESIEINPSTQVTVDDYISDLQFELSHEHGSVIYTTSPNDRIFKATDTYVYKNIRFNKLPLHYNLKYYDQDGNEVILNESQAKALLPIYDDVSGETYNRRFVLVPTDDYLETHQGLEAEIQELIEQKNQEEKDFYKKYSRFLQEGTWSSQDYIDPELYYFDALQVSNTSAQPKVSYKIDVLEVSQVDGLENYDFRVGDKTYIEDTDFFGYLYQPIDIRSIIEIDKDASKRAPIDNEIICEDDLPVAMTIQTPVREEVVVSEVEWHLDEPDNNTITVQNYKTQFEDLFQRISATVQTVQRNEVTYPKTSSILDQSGLINSALLADSLNGIGGVGFALTTNGSVTATEDGLMIRNLLNPANVMRVASNGMQVSTDNGENWNTAVSAEGISTDVLTAGTINTQKIWLMDGDNPSFRWDKSGLNAYGFDENGNNSYDLKTYVRFDKYGLYGIKNDEDYVASSLDDVRNKAFFGITWDGFFIKNSYANGGEVSITSDEDIVVKGSNGNKRIWIGAVEKDNAGTPIKYGINIMNDDGDVVFDTGDDGNITMTGTINAQAGMFTGAVSVGKPNGTHIVIDGESDNPTISSSNYSDSAGTGWIIDSNGDATFSNVSVRGAIKTAVFEYEEIQAVGGAFLFRPSSTIKSARYIPTEVTETDDEGVTTTFETYYHYDNGSKIYNDLLVTVEKPLMFTLHNWVKLSNYNELGVDPAADLTTYGLVHVYEISETNFTPTTVDTYDILEEPVGNPSEQQYYEKVNDIYVLSEDTTVVEGKTYYIKEQLTVEPTYELALSGGCAILDEIIIENIEGGALIDFGSHKQEGGIDVPGDHNYGIGINSSDNYVNLPARAISLFETTIHPNATTKVTYDYQGILGTLPALPASKVSPIYSAYMKDKQGIFTNNMYIGDKDQFIAFYTNDQNQKQLKIKASQIVYEVVDKETGQPTGEWNDVNDIEEGAAGEDAISVKIESNIGNVILYDNETIRLTCNVIKGEGTDITNQVTNFNWYKVNRDGQRDITWSQPNRSYIDITASDINFRAQIGCEVTFE